jgi:hypothetical protein
MRFIYEAVRVNNEELVKKQNFYQNVRKERWWWVTLGIKK